MINDETLDHLSSQAKIRLTPEENEQIKRDINEMLDFASIIHQIDTSDVEDMPQIHDLTTVLREDVVEPSLSQEELFKNAPKQNEHLFSVPKMIK